MRTAVLACLKWAPLFVPPHLTLIPLCPFPLSTAGDLGAIAKEYDIAVSTSCPALDYIVVDTTSAAQRCVELLRQVGRS